MSIQAVGWALDQDLPARNKLVLVAIANHANHADGYCWLKAETIAAEASCSPRAVFNFVGDLIRNGYVRKTTRRAGDGRQRASDYWILFTRTPAPWIKRGAADAPEDDFDDSDQDETASQDVVQPDASLACGDEAQPEATVPTQLPAGAVRPHAPACMHKDSEEPSKTKPENMLPRGATPRRYAPPPPPPPQPLGSTIDGNTELRFVFKPSHAYDAWARFKERERAKVGDYRKFDISTYRNGRAGWYFPTLFPPDDRETEPIPDPLDPPFQKRSA